MPNYLQYGCSWLICVGLCTEYCMIATDNRSAVVGPINDVNG